ncbi:DDE-type integrase/transposase/recombinase [Castellaniella sp.]|uniref:DDE-type integrase/transposase/recombinase n=1 Tax=Castellaniella sp. TaxID=1955812 RepID=UPI002AFFE710|nr:DDE-type integrase/transposase/recombinase [Castellaniella sp.]
MAIETMIACIRKHRHDDGGGPVCRVPLITASACHESVAMLRCAERQSVRAQLDDALKPEVLRVFTRDWDMYGVCKIWRRVKRASIDVARCALVWLKCELGLQSEIKGKLVLANIPDKMATRSLDQVSCQFLAPVPAMLWAHDFTEVATRTRFCCVDFVIDVYARIIAGWRISKKSPVGFLPCALVQAIYERRPLHRSDRASHYASTKYMNVFSDVCIGTYSDCIGNGYNKNLMEIVVISTNMKWSIAIPSGFHSWLLMA